MTVRQVETTKWPNVFAGRRKAATERNATATSVSYAGFHAMAVEAEGTEGETKAAVADLVDEYNERDRYAPSCSC